MKNTIKLLVLGAIFVMACGDNKESPDARVKNDSGGTPDGQCSNCPAAPTLGAQIDRMGRPAINTVLNRGFTTANTTALKDAYNQDADKAHWATNVPEFMKNLGVLDALDTGFCGNARCELGETNATCAGDCPNAAQVGAGDGCGNQVLFNGNPSGGGTPAATSYGTLATILANDELFVDTSKGLCALYLAVEFGEVTGMGNSTCGGRAPQYDVIDISLTMLAEGIAGFSTDGMFTPELKDGANPHGDYLTSFPFLGAPHS